MSFDINISKIKCSGKHGIYNHEKQSEQEFLVDIHIYISDVHFSNILFLRTIRFNRDSVISKKAGDKFLETNWKKSCR